MVLYSGKQISNMYSRDGVKITESTVRKWASQGLKHMVGERGLFLYTKEWVDNFIEEEAERRASEFNKVFEVDCKKPKAKQFKMIANSNYRVK